MKMNTKRRIRSASRRLPAFKGMTDEQCEQVAAAVKKKDQDLIMNFEEQIHL